ncbi:MAG: hypothetical protein VW907_08315, partial [Opitutae bacterium]
MNFMKAVSIFSSLSLLALTFSFGQTQREVRNRIEGSNRPDATNQISSAKSADSGTSSASASDAGA